MCAGAVFFFSSRRRHTRCGRDWSSDVCSSDLLREHAAAADPVAALSDQEKRVLELIGEGLTNRQIAERMFLAEKTVKNYVSSLLTKLGMQRRTQAAAFAVRHADDQDR